MTEEIRLEGPLTLERMRADVAEMLHQSPEEIADDDNLMDLGVDSLRAMTLVLRWREAGAEIEFADLAERPELGHCWAIVSAKRRPAS